MNLQKAIIELQSRQNSSSFTGIISGLDGRSFITTTIVYLICFLSLPIEEPERLLWFAVYPILMAPLAGVRYSEILKRSLYVLPFIVLIGIFNPLIDKRPAFAIGDVTVSMGWITFLTILIRGLLSVQAILIMIYAIGFRKLCYSLNRMGLPRILATQLLLMYRFIGVLLEEAMTMHRAVVARCYGRKAFSIKIWARIVGSLLLRTSERSQKIYDAMVSRGYEGTLWFAEEDKIKGKDIIFCLGWCGFFILLRFVDFSALLFNV